MLREKSCFGKYLLTVIVMLAVLALAAHAPAADGKPPTVSILNPKPGTAAAPTIVSLRPQSNDFKVQVQVWDDGAITANSVQIGYYAGATPDSGAFTFVTAALNSNYTCGTNCGIYDAVIGGLTANTTYYLYARATSGDGTGESRQNRTGNDARYLAIRIVAARTGTGMLLVRDSSSQFCLDCHNLPPHSSQATGTTYGNWQTVCLDCHTAHTTRNLFIVKESVITPNSGTRAVTFYKTTGDAVNSYVTASLGAATRGICQVCHTQTKNPVTLVSRWTNAGNADASHYQSPKPNSARCTDCHNHTAGFANTAGDCKDCHSIAQGGRRPVLGVGGDFAGNTSIASRHVGGAVDPTPAQCLVCHDLSRHTQGTVRLRHGDTGSVSAYNPLQLSTLEPFCLSCHDGDGAGGDMSPFGDGATLGAVPFVAGTTIASSWSGSSAHRSKGLTCAGTGSPNTGCHGRSGSINMHGSTVKGMLTNTMNFQIPLVSAAVYSADPLGSSWSYSNYQLCLDCHANYPAATKEVVLGYRRNGVYDKKNSPTPYYTLGMQSLFREHYVGPDPLRPYSDTIGGDTYLALHNYHLIGFEGNVLASDPSTNMLQWNYRGDPARAGRITCTACHNVHGTIAATIRSTHQVLGLVRDYYSIAFGFSSQPGESYTSIDSLIDATIMGSHPMNCAVICHQGSSGILTQSYWHTPNGD